MGAVQVDLRPPYAILVKKCLDTNRSVFGVWCGCGNAQAFACVCLRRAGSTVYVCSCFCLITLAGLLPWLVVAVCGCPISLPGLLPWLVVAVCGCCELPGSTWPRRCTGMPGAERRLEPTLPRRCVSAFLAAACAVFGAGGCCFAVPVRGPPCACDRRVCGCAASDASAPQAACNAMLRIAIVDGVAKVAVGILGNALSSGYVHCTSLLRMFSGWCLLQPRLRHATRYGRRGFGYGGVLVCVHVCVRVCGFLTFGRLSFRVEAPLPQALFDLLVKRKMVSPFPLLCGSDSPCVPCFVSKQLVPSLPRERLPLSAH